MSHFSHSKLGGFSIPSEIVRDHRLKPNERLFLMTVCLLADKTGYCRHGLPSIEEVCGISAGNTGPSIAGLEALGWLVRESGKAKRRTNQYRISVPEEGVIPFKGATWKYGRATPKNLTPAELSAKLAATLAKVEADCNAARVKRATLAGKVEAPAFDMMDADELLEEIARESVSGVQHVPIEYLENFGIVRDADNSHAVRQARVFGGCPADYD